jgi:predicted transcriptional regulator
MDKEPTKKNLKGIMKEMGISYQNVANNSGVSKADVCRVMDSDMEAKVIKTVCNLIMERNKSANKAVKEWEKFQQ